MNYNYHLWGRTTPEESDDITEDDPGITSILHGRLGLNKFSDNDADDADADCQTIHHRRNIMSLPSAPDPYFKRGK